MKIKNLILDLGGVLYDLDYLKTQDAFSSLGLGDYFSQAEQSSLFDDLEEGKISEDEFCNDLISVIKETGKAERGRSRPEKSQIIDSWNAMLLGMKADKFELLTELKAKYNLYLYSNTNAIHIKAVWEHYREVHGISNLDDYFIKVYLSNDMGIRKPKEAGFDLIVRENNLIKEETLFIDDSPQHVTGAISSGINGFWLDLKKEDLRSLLKRQGL
jgi:FMN phosphatase YigB (HAD superfamily)